MTTPCKIIGLPLYICLSPNASSNLRYLSPLARFSSALGTTTSRQHLHSGANGGVMKTNDDRQQEHNRAHLGTLEWPITSLKLRRRRQGKHTSAVAYVKGTWHQHPKRPAPRDDHPTQGSTWSPKNLQKCINHRKHPRDRKKKHILFRLLWMLVGRPYGGDLQVPLIWDHIHRVLCG